MSRTAAGSLSIAYFLLAFCSLIIESPLLLLPTPATHPSCTVLNNLERPFILAEDSWLMSWEMVSLLIRAPFGHGICSSSFLDALKEFERTKGFFTVFFNDNFYFDRSSALKT